ncbi:helix-turn-helix domain-containing protein [Bacillus infantis]|uniref:helix-turn-helix domain-containing protein n=1 Tax=Bacillus infantis TaxID=324767 RepID=UPI003CE9AC2F
MVVRNNLAVIMAQKGIRSISELQRIMEDKGHPVARRTLDRFYKNENNQIHYDTIADICSVLEIGIGDLFSLVEDK